MEGSLGNAPAAQPPPAMMLHCGKKSRDLGGHLGVPADTLHLFVVSMDLVIMESRRNSRMKYLGSIPVSTT